RAGTPSESDDRSTDAERKKRGDQHAARIPVQFAHAAVTEDHVQRARDPSVQRLKPERRLPALQPEAFHEDAVCVSLKHPEIVAPITGSPRAAASIIHGVPIVSRTPVVLRSRAGSGITIAPLKASAAHRAPAAGAIAPTRNASDDAHAVHASADVLRT